MHTNMKRLGNGLWLVVLLSMAGLAMAATPDLRLVGAAAQQDVQAVQAEVEQKVVTLTQEGHTLVPDGAARRAGGASAVERGRRCQLASGGRGNGAPVGGTLG